VDFEKIRKIIREDIEAAEKEHYNDKAYKRYLHSIAIALETLVGIEVEKAKREQ